MGSDIVLILSISILFLMCIYVIWFVIDLQKFRRKRQLIIIKVITTILGCLVFAYLLLNFRNISANEWLISSLTIVLVLITSIYAWSTSKMAKANAAMAEEMREQRIISSKPIIIQKVATINVIPPEKSVDYFEIYNAGNGVAIDIEISIVQQRNPPYLPLDGKKEGFLRAGDIPIEFHPTLPQDNNAFYVVSEYKGISTSINKTEWYQTWLRCQLSITGKVICGELEIIEINEQQRVNLYKEAK